jgi:choline dehydrogenase-like flavoprotein
MADDQHYDVVIIGTVAGGGSLRHRLATNGVKVLWLERGPLLPRERDNWQTDAVFVRGKYLAQELWYDRHGNEFQPEVNYYVGGNTINPSLTAIANALRVGDHISERLR